MKNEPLKLDEILSSHVKPPNPCKCIVRISTSAWSDRRGLYHKRSITFLRKKSHGINILEEDVSAVGADESISRIVNLQDCKDGIYQCVICNERRDWETGIIDDYDLKLIPISTPPTSTDKGE